MEEPHAVIEIPVLYCLCCCVSRSLGVKEPHAVVEIPALYCLCCMILGLWEWRSHMLWLGSLLYIVCVVCF